LSIQAGTPLRCCRRGPLGKTIRTRFSIRQWSTAQDAPPRHPQERQRLLSNCSASRPQPQQIGLVTSGRNSLIGPGTELIWIFPLFKIFRSRRISEVVQGRSSDRDVQCLQFGPISLLRTTIESNHGLDGARVRPPGSFTLTNTTSGNSVPLKLSLVRKKTSQPSGSFGSYSWIVPDRC